MHCKPFCSGFVALKFILSLFLLGLDSMWLSIMIFACRNLIIINGRCFCDFMFEKIGGAVWRLQSTESKVPRSFCRCLQCVCVGFHKAWVLFLNKRYIIFVIAHKEYQMWTRRLLKLKSLQITPLLWALAV